MARSRKRPNSLLMFYHINVDVLSYKGGARNYLSHGYIRDHYKQHIYILTFLNNILSIMTKQKKRSFEYGVMPMSLYHNVASMCQT